MSSVSMPSKMEHLSHPLVAEEMQMQAKFDRSKIPTDDLLRWMEANYTNADDYEVVPTSIPDEDSSFWLSSCGESCGESSAVSSADSDESLSVSSSPLLSPSLCESLWRAPTPEPDSLSLEPEAFDDSLTSLPFQGPLMEVGDLPLNEDEPTLQCSPPEGLPSPQPTIYEDPGRPANTGPERIQRQARVQRSNSSRRVYVCDVSDCRKRISLVFGRQAAERHAATHRPSSEKWACPGCNKPLSRPDSLLRHLRIRQSKSCKELFEAYGAKVNGRKEPREMDKYPSIKHVVQLIYAERGSNHWSMA